MNLEVLPHDFWKLQPLKLYKNVQESSCLLHLQLHDKIPSNQQSTITFNVASHDENLDQSMLRLTIPDNLFKGLISSSSALSVLSLILYFGVFSSFCSIIELGTWSC